MKIGLAQVVFALMLTACIGMTYFTDDMAVITLVIIINSCFALYVLKNEDLAYPSAFLTTVGILVGLLGMCLAVTLGNYYLVVLALPWSGMMVVGFILVLKR
ncbi:hypothetical protein [Bacillus phage CP-51]|uniref:Uncharacterized protein n=1 Tax=Bacillus phage CP-51 TaxID=1391188 RepID=A0A068EMK2_9CAUD|nr:hypothetical protein OZ73_gp198 [Bacillus phage CP-51]AID50633.1 hypothetical protein [Bacillus phage CP-51]